MPAPAKLTIIVGLSRESVVPVSVGYLISGFSPDDFGGPLADTLTFVPGQTERRVELPLTAQTLLADKTGQLALVSPLGCTLGVPSGTTVTMQVLTHPGFATLSILTAPGDVAISRTATVNATVIVTLDELLDADASATWTLSGLSSADVVGPLSGTVTVPAGQAQAGVPLAFAAQSLTVDRAAAFSLSAPSNCVLEASPTRSFQLVPQGVPTLSILTGPGDVAPSATATVNATVTVQLDAPTDADASATWTLSGLSSADVVGSLSGTATVPAGQSRAVVPLAFAAQSFSADKAAAFSLSSPSGCVLEASPTRSFKLVHNVAPPVPAATVTSAFGNVPMSTDAPVSRTAILALSNASDTPASVTWTISGLTKSDVANGKLTGTATFDPGKTSLPLEVIFAAETVASDKAATLTISAPSGCTIGTPASAAFTLLHTTTGGATGFVSAATHGNKRLIGLSRPKADILKAPSHDSNPKNADFTVNAPRDDVTYDFRGLTFHNHIDNKSRHSLIGIASDKDETVLFGGKFIGGGTGTKGEDDPLKVTWGMRKHGDDKNRNYPQGFPNEIYNNHAGGSPWDGDCYYWAALTKTSRVECAFLHAQQDGINPVKGGGPKGTVIVASSYFRYLGDDNESDNGGTTQVWDDCFLEDCHTWVSASSVPITVTATNCLIHMGRLPYDCDGVSDGGSPHAGNKYSGQYPNQDTSLGKTTVRGWCCGRVFKTAAGTHIDLKDCIIRIDGNQTFDNDSWPSGNIDNVAVIYLGTGVYPADSHDHLPAGVTFYSGTTGPHSAAAGLALWNRAVDEWLIAHGCATRHDFGNGMRDVPFTNANS